MVECMRVQNMLNSIDYELSFRDSSVQEQKPQRIDLHSMPAQLDRKQCLLESADNIIYSMFRIKLTDRPEVDEPDNRLSTLYNMSAMYGKFIGKVLAKVSDFD